MKSRLEYLDVSVERQLVFKAFTQAIDGVPNKPRPPQTYTDIKTRAESEARVHYGPCVAEGERKGVSFDAIFRTAINSHDIQHVQGGYVITDSGLRHLKMMGQRLDGLK